MLIIQRPTIEALGDDVNNRQSFGIGPLDPGFGQSVEVFLVVEAEGTVLRVGETKTTRALQARVFFIRGAR